MHEFIKVLEILFNWRKYKKIHRLRLEEIAMQGWIELGVRTGQDALVPSVLRPGGNWGRDRYSVVSLSQSQIFCRLVFTIFLTRGSLGRAKSGWVVPV